MRNGNIHKVGDLLFKMLYDNTPDDFISKFEVVSIFIVHNKEILFLQRQTFKPEGGQFGVVAGKVDKEEELLEALIRETFEETQIELEEKNISFLKTYYVKFPTYSFTYHLYHIEFDEKPQVVINPQEHLSYTWRTKEEALKLDLIQDLQETLEEHL